MEENTYLNFEGLAYYDQKIKEYIDKQLLIQALVREQYTASQEVIIIRQRKTDPSTYDIYKSFRKQCEQAVEEALGE